MLSVNTFYQFYLPFILVRKCDKEDFISEILEINKSSPISGPPLDEPNVNIGQAISKLNG